MDMKDLINHQLIDLDLAATNKATAFQKLADLLYQEKRITSCEGFLDDIYQRELIDTTAIGYKIAIPHAKSKHVTTPSLVFARSNQGIDCRALDSNLTHLFFMIAMPEESINMHLKALAMISRKLMKASFRDELMEAQTKDAILALLYQID